MMSLILWCIGIVILLIWLGPSFFLMLICFAILSALLGIGGKK